MGKHHLRDHPQGKAPGCSAAETLLTLRMWLMTPSANQWTYIVNRLTLQVFITNMLILVCPSEIAAGYKP